MNIVSKDNVSKDSEVRPSGLGDSSPGSLRIEGRESLYPLAFVRGRISIGAESYRRDSMICTLLEFFERKGIEALKDEDRHERWYDDWIYYQRRHEIYASMLSPAQYSSRGARFDLHRYARFLEAFAYCSPAHGYSLQVTFLGLFSILMGTNTALKHEAVAKLEAGGLLGFGVSEKRHGSDLMGNEFTIAETSEGLVARGRKHYIGNTDVASMLSILGRKTGSKNNAEHEDSRSSRIPFILIALRPERAVGFRSLGKIRTLGVRAANVGSFEVNNQLLSRSDVIAEGRSAWDAVFGTVTLGKFFLGFGSIGICEHALEEAAQHLQTRRLYGKPAIDLPHIRYSMAQAFVRLTAMKLYAYRALDYVHAAARTDRRYLLFCAVQKAKVSTEGVRVMAILQECMGAKGFESDTYFEMALRDIQLIPGLEGSMHINLGLAVQFLPRYLNRPDPTLPEVPSLTSGETSSNENEYLMEARTGSLHSIAFRSFLDAYRPLQRVPNVALFSRQVEIFQRLSTLENTFGGESADSQVTMALGQCFATIVYGQLIAEYAERLSMPLELTSCIFAGLVEDLGALAVKLAAVPRFDGDIRRLLMQMVAIPETTAADWEFIGQQIGVPDTEHCSERELL